MRHITADRTPNIYTVQGIQDIISKPDKIYPADLGGVLFLLKLKSLSNLQRAVPLCNSKCLYPVPVLPVSCVQKFRACKGTVGLMSWDSQRVLLSHTFPIRGEQMQS
jgi:hypothetical protein